MQDSGNSECALLKPAADGTSVAPSIYNIANRITGVDRAIIARYFEERRSLAGITDLSSRLRRRWVVGARLPANLLTAALPRQLEKTLSSLDAEYVRLLVGYEVLCVEAATLIIVDVMRHAGAPPRQSTAQWLVDATEQRPAAWASRVE